MDELAGVTMKLFRVLIVDDEALARRRIRRLLADREEVELLPDSVNGVDAVDAIQAHRPHLIFLDVQMPQLDGLGVLESVGIETVGAVIFVTAYDEYALQAFDHHAVDYLLKPYSDSRFMQALRRAEDRVRRRAAESTSHRLLAVVEEYRSLTNVGLSRAETDGKRVGQLAIRVDGRVRFVRFEDIAWIEAEGSYVQIHTPEESWLVRDTLANVEERLPTHAFARVHRSSIVRIDRVVEVKSLNHGDLNLILNTGASVKLSRSYRARILELLGPW